MVSIGPDTYGEHLVGVLGGTRHATVDGAGTVRPQRALWSLEWWIGGDDRWHVPAHEAAVRRSLVDDMPVVRTAMRIPGGDAVHEVYGVTGDAVVIDVENASPAPFVLAIVVRGATVVARFDTTVLVDSVPAITALRPPSRWASSSTGALESIVTSGGAHEAEMPVLRDRHATLDCAFLYPVAHRTRLRFAVALGRHDTAGVRELDLTAMPDAATVVRGWQAQLARGMRVELPDPARQSEIDAARACVLLAGQANLPAPAVVAALEDWGFDEEALTAWHRLGFFAKRRAARRDVGASPASSPGSMASGSAALTAAHRLLAIRRQLLREDARTLQLFPEWPSAWNGQAVDVRDAPTRLGPVSFSVRWHGERPALLWEAPAGAQVCAPGLDPTWASSDQRGETLLARVQ